MTHRDLLERSNANGRWVTETMFLATIDRIDGRFDKLESMLVAHVVQHAEDDGENAANTRFNQQVERRAETHADRWWQVKHAMISACFGGAVGAVASVLLS